MRATSGLHCFFVSGQAACRDGVAARAWPEAPCRASPGLKNTGPGRARFGPG
jgi:hypothetical protein